MLLSKQRLILISLVVVVVAPKVFAAERPNVLIVLTDDQGWGDLSIHGNTNLHTPNIDDLARQSTTLDRFFVCPVCSPTRAEFLTGRYYPRGGIRGVSRGEERLDLDETTIGDVFRAGGYRTGAFGKWHNGTQHPYHPNARGFDEYYGFCSGHWGNYWDPIMDHNGEIVSGKGFIIDDLTDHAIEFIEQVNDQPFFCYVPYNTPHSPMQVPDEYWDKHKSQTLKKSHREPKREQTQHTRAALAMCENIDWNTGRLLATLEQQGVADNTIVIYFSDNGPNGYRWNGGMKGRKGSTDEGGVRSPFFIRWPAKIQAGQSIEAISGAIDLLPTLVDLAGLEYSSAKPLDGRSLKPLLTGNPKEWTDRSIVSSWGGRPGNRKISARNQRYRLDSNGQLFDMMQDPGQHTDVSQQQPNAKRDLLAKQQWYRDTVLTELTSEQRPFAVGHATGRVTQLPIRDAVSTGEIQRSARPPNSSYFTNWLSTDDQITWAVEVHESGMYEAELLYTCDEENAGARIRLEQQSNAGKTKVEQVAVIHESDLVAADQDRYPRREGFEKTWGRMPLGTISLNEGISTLRLTAPEIPGSAAIDVRMLLLRRNGSGVSSDGAAPSPAD